MKALLPSYRATAVRIIRGRWFRGATIAVLVILLGLELYFFRERFAGLLSWPLLAVSLIAFAFVALWLRAPAFKRLIGEGKTNHKRSRMYWVLASVSVFILVIPVGVYLLKSLAPQPIQPVQQLSVIAISLSFSAISFALASIRTNKRQKRIELICVGQKFVLATILFILFAPFIDMIDKSLGGINVNTLDLLHPNSWFRGVAFYLAAVWFYGGVSLFFFGVIDMLRAFVSLH